MTIGTPLLITGEQSWSLARTPLKPGSDQQFPESMLQNLIHRWPNMLPISDFYPSVTGICSLGREIPVDIGSKEGFIDNLLLTDDGHLVIVETKLWRNPESQREVVAQILQYGMAISQLSLDELEGRLRRGLSEGRLGAEETILQRARSVLPEKTDDFEDAFDRIRIAGEVLLLIVAEGIHSSAERLVQWINNQVSGAPCKFGIVELCIYDMPDTGRILVPKTLLRIREASRHVVSINIQGAGREHVTATVSAPNELPGTRKIAPSGIPLTEEGLTEQIRAKNPRDIAALTEELRRQLDASEVLRKRALPSTIQYGVEVAGEFIPLVSLNAANLWFQIPKKAVRDLGGVRFVECKQKINAVAAFYRSEDVSDPDKTNALGPKYAIVQDKVEAFVDAVTDIAETVRSAVGAAS